VPTGHDRGLDKVVSEDRAIEDPVPADNFYRHLEPKLDLGLGPRPVRTTCKEF